MGKRSIGWVLFLFLIAAVCRAQDSESAQVVEPGSFQMESSFSVNWCDGTRSRDTEVLLRMGATPRTEFWLGLPAYSVVNESDAASRAFGNGSFGVKWLLAEGDEAPSLRRPTVSVFAAAYLPEAEDMARSKRWDMIAALAFGWTLPSGFTLDANLGHEQVGECEEAGHRQLCGTLCLTRSWTEVVSSYIELHADRPFGRGFSSRQYLNAGIGVVATPHLDIVFSGGVGLSGGPRETVFDTTITRRW